MLPRHVQTEMIWTLWGAMLCAVVSLPLGRRLTERTECADNPCLNGGICYLGGFEGVDADKGPVWSCECEPGFKGRLCRSSSSASGSASPASHGVSKDLSPKLKGQEKQVPAPGGADGGFEFEPDRTHAGHAVLTGLTQANTLGSEDDAGIGAVTLARSDSGLASVHRAPERPPAEPSASPTSAAPHPLGSKQGKLNAPKPPKASIVLSQGRFYLLLLTHVLVDLAMGW